MGIFGSLTTFSTTELKLLRPKKLVRVRVSVYVAWTSLPPETINGLLT
jgi:fluoride ion exporter CrcB/FEX